MEITKLLLFLFIFNVLGACKCAYNTPPMSNVKEVNNGKDIVRSFPELKLLEDGTIVPLEGKGMSKKEFNRWIAGHGWIEVTHKRVDPKGNNGKPSELAKSNESLAGDADTPKLYFSKDSVVTFTSIAHRTFHWKEPFSLNKQWNIRTWKNVRREVFFDKENPTNFIMTTFMTILSFDKDNKEFMALERTFFQRKGKTDPISFDKMLGYNILWFRQMSEKELEDTKRRYSLSRKEYEHRKYGI